MGSCIGNSGLELCGANNANNQLIFNGSNGNLNNNNRINSNQVRVALDLYSKEDDPSAVSAADWFNYYRIARRHKKNKDSHLKFRIHCFDQLDCLRQMVENFEYVPERSRVFAVTYPKPREIIAADFADRIVQTYLVQRILPSLEEYLSPYSYSCRKWKGGLRAAQHLHEEIFKATNGYTTDAWIYKMDFKGFFMSVDTELWTKRLCEWIDEHVRTSDVERLKYLARVIYQSLPQCNCDISGDPLTLNCVPEHKKQRGKATFFGIPIGNVTSQTLILFATTPFLDYVGSIVSGFSHYTDDNCGVVTDRDGFLAKRALIADFAEKDSHFHIHPDKFYFQHHSKGVEFLGYRLRYGRMLPSKRLMHNFSWKITVAVNRAANQRWMIRNKEHMMSVINSYCGLLKHTASYNFRKRELSRLQASEWSMVFDFDETNWLKVGIKPHYNINNYYKRLARKRKKSTFNLN